MASELEGLPIVDDIKTVALEHAKAGTWAEFGVFKGNSARHLIGAMPDNTNIHLFDSFEGLPEKWDMGDTRDIRYFTLTPDDRISIFRAFKGDVRVKVHKGWFSDTLPKADMGVLALVHIDCDLYSSTVTVLENIEVASGTVIIFDEYHGYPNSENHERKAFHEWIERTGIEFKWLAKGRMQAVGKVV